MKRILTGFLLVFLFLSRSYGQQTAANFTFDVVCKGETTTLTSTSTVLPGDAIIIYMWDTTWNDGVLNPVQGTPAFGPEVTIHFPGPGVYDIGLKIYTQFNLMESIYRQVAISDVSAEFSVANLCFGDATQFTDLSTFENSTVTQWYWTFGDTYASNLPNPTHQYGAPGTYTANLAVTTVNGCTSNITQIIDIKDTPHFDLIYSINPVNVIGGVPQFEFYENQSMTVTANITSDYTGIMWSTWEATPSITVNKAGYYTCEVVNQYGCKTTLSFVVTVIEDRLVQPIPVLTPNGDGSNDVFLIKRYILPGDRYALTIFNRYGNEVYSSSNYQNDWNGDYKGTKVPEGPYYYFLKDKDGHEWKGPVNVLYNK